MVPIVSAAVKPAPAGRRAQRIGNEPSSVGGWPASQASHELAVGCTATCGRHGEIVVPGSRLSGAPHGPPRGR